MIGFDYMNNFFFINILKAIGVMLISIVPMGFLSLLIVFISEKNDLGEKSSPYSTTIGNALLVLHSYLEPGKKAETQQILWIKKRKTPFERNFLGLSSLDYDKICIKGYSKIKNKKYKRKY